MLGLVLPCRHAAGKCDAKAAVQLVQAQFPANRFVLCVLPCPRRYLLLNGSARTFHERPDDPQYLRAISETHSRARSMVLESREGDFAGMCASPMASSCSHPAIEAGRSHQSRSHVLELAEATIKAIPRGGARSLSTVKTAGPKLLGPRCF